jgi:predicted dehydrogenase
MFTRPTVSDVAFLTLDFGDFLGHIQLSCIDPEKVRRATVAGTTGGIVYDDVDGAVRIFVNGSAVAPETHVPNPTSPPLDVEISHFAECIHSGAVPKTGGIHGAMVVAVLEAASASAAQGGAWIDITGPRSQLASLIHPVPTPDKGARLSLVTRSQRMALA